MGLHYYISLNQKDIFYFLEDEREKEDEPYVLLFNYCTTYFNISKLSNHKSIYFLYKIVSKHPYIVTIFTGIIVKTIL